MKFNKVALILPATALIALTVSVPAGAGQRGQRDDRRSAGQRQGSRAPDSGRAQPREGQSAPDPRAQGQRPQAPAPQAENQRREGPAPQSVGPRVQGGARVAPQQQPQGYAQRGIQDRRYGSAQSYGNGNSRGFRRDGVIPRSNYSYSAGRYDYRPVYRPYYSFRPRFTLGFGLYLGYPVSFPSWYDPYQPGYYSYYRPGAAYGGISFDIEPYDAAVYVDGVYMGVVEDFSSTEPPLTLTAGRHHIDLEGRGFQRMSFDINVLPRQVIPYQGTLGRY